MARILKGQPVAQEIKQVCGKHVAKMLSNGKLVPKLVIVGIGDDESNASYIRGIHRAAADTGVLVRVDIMPDDCTMLDLEAKIEALNNSDTVDGILMLRPLPKNNDIDESKICEMISPEKDVDAANPINVCSSYLQNGGYSPCTAEAIMKVFQHYDIALDGKKVCVIGRSLVVGKPVANLLINKNATVVTCHTHTKELCKISKKADIVILASGVPKEFGPEYFSEGQIVIDAGINWDQEQNKICGDVDFDKVEPIVDAITPVPGGIGVITSCVLIEHTIQKK